MTDASYVFKQTALERKRTARGAYAKKGGSKSKKVTFPSDNLSRSEKKKLNGDVMKYDLSKPMDWATFRGLPKDLRSEYLKKLGDMGAHVDDVCDMFGTTKTAYANFAHKNHNGERFFHRYADNTPFMTWYCDSIDGEKPEAEAEAPKPAEKTIKPQLNLKSGTLTYEGDPVAILKAIQLSLDPDRQYSITVSFSTL